MQDQSYKVKSSGTLHSKQLNSSDIIASIRDLIVSLHRSNGPQAEALVTEIARCLKEMMLSGADPATLEMQRAQQTMFAIDEVRMLLAQQDFEGATTAARDAGKEWRLKSASD
jgi:hypothetical protein